MWLKPHFPANLVTFTEEIFNGKFHFLCSADTLVFSFLESLMLVLENNGNNFQIEKVQYQYQLLISNSFQHFQHTDQSFTFSIHT